MKELIVICGTVVLGCIIFSMICGPEHALSASSAKYMRDMTAEYGVLT